MLKRPGAARRNRHSAFRIPHSAFGATFRTRSARAFTLVEMMVVVGILAILVAIALPVSSALINNQRSKSTLSTMQTVETAIASYVSERPLGTQPYFGPYPPTPTSPDTLDASRARPSTPDPVVIPPGYEDYSETVKKFNQLLTPLGFTTDYFFGESARNEFLDIECAILYLRKHSPAAKGILDGLASKYLTNQDKDFAKLLVNPVLPEDNNTNPAVATELLEVHDPWDRPLRYSVQVPVTDGSTGRSIPLRWELRSAGSDGKFMPTFEAQDPQLRAAFTPDEQQSDDVFLRGP